MNKTIEAFVRGYLFFDVNGKRFLLYHSAVSYRKTINGNLLFKGWHISKGWQGFFERLGVEE
jgi:hypothetical protein